MKAVCDTCGARYRIPDEKAAGKVLQIRCRKCGNIFKYQGTSTATQARAPKGNWFFAIDGESFGPYTERELLTRFESGKLGLNTHVWKDGFSDWMPVAEHPEFAAAIELSKDKLRRLGAQRPESTRTTEGSGRFTVDIRRPGATVDDETQAQRDALNDEVDHAFQSLIGQSAEPQNDTSDELTPTTPMRVFAARHTASTDEQVSSPTKSSPSTPTTRTPSSEKPPARAETIRPRTDPAAPQRPAASQENTRDAATHSSKAPARPRATTPTPSPVKTASANKAPARSSQPLSLSERLKMIREQSAAGSAASTKPSGLPQRTSSLPARSTTAPSAAKPTTDVPTARTATNDAPFDLQTQSASTAIRDPSASEEDTPTGPHTTRTSTDPKDILGRAPEITPVGQTAVAPLPSGPIRQVTQEIDIGDLFDQDTALPEPAKPAAAVPVPSDEDLQAHLSKRKEARARGDQPSPKVDPDAPPFILDTPTSKSSEPSVRTSTSTPYRLDGVTDVHDDEPPYILDGPAKSSIAPAVKQDDVTPVGGTAAVQTPAATLRRETHTASLPAAQQSSSNDRRKLLIIILVIALLILLLIGGWMWLRASSHDESASLDAALQEIPADPIDRTDTLYARNRAIGIVAQARGAAESAAFVASEDVRVANARARRGPTRSGQTNSSNTRNSAGPPPIEFTTASSTNSRLGIQREASAQGPSKALFADTLRSNVSRSVARCAQRTLGIEGFLPVSRLELSITIRPDGTVQQVKAQREAHSGPLMICISNESQRWSFSKFTGRATTISHPFVIQ